MRGTKKLQTEIEKLVFSSADAKGAVKSIVGLLFKLTRSKVALLSRHETEDRCAGIQTHLGLTPSLADSFYAALNPYRKECLRSGKTFSVNSIDKAVLDAFPEELRSMKIGKLLLVPMFKARKPLGLLIFARGTTKFDTDIVESIEPVRANLILLLEQIGYLEKISIYSNFANYDGLTGLHNHRYFQETLSREISRGQRLGHPVSVMMLDIDHFKQYNDTFGHPNGDMALKEIANVLKRSTRSYDLAARYGGEEMVIVLPHTSPHQAEPIAERIRKAVSELYFRGATDTHRVQLTVSIGIAGLPAHAKSKSELIERADQALYLAKEEGRNRVNISLVRSRKSIQFAYCPPAFTSSYYADVLTGVREVVEQLGGITLISRAPEKESDHQGFAEICRSLIKSKVDAVALATYSDAVVPIIKEFNKARIPVFFFNVPRQIKGVQFVSHVGYRQVEAGGEAGRYLARMLRGKGSVLVLKGLTNTTSKNRVAGFREALESYPQLRVVATRQADWEREKAQKVTARILEKHNLDAIFAVSDEMALGAADAVNAAGRQGEIFIVGLDGTNTALQGIRDGALTATLNTNPREMGRILMRTVVRGLNRRESVESEILSPINIIDLENVSYY